MRPMDIEIHGREKWRIPERLCENPAGRITGKNGQITALDKRVFGVIMKNRKS